MVSRKKSALSKKNKRLTVISPEIFAEKDKTTINNPKYGKWLVFIMAFLLYSNTLDLHYTLDDTLMITGNSFTKKGVDGIKDIFTNDAFVGFLGKNNLLPGGRYRPLSQVMFAIEYEILGFNPFVGHLLNVLFYALLCMLLYIILTRLFKNYKSQFWYLSPAFIISILFAFHPLHTEVVANIKGRDEILSLLLCLICVYLTLLYIEKNKVIYLILSMFSHLLAILSKENAITFIAVIPLILYFFTKAGIKQYMMTLVPLVISSVAYFILRIFTIGPRITDVKVNEILNDPFLGVEAASKYATILFTWAKYLWLMIFPHPLTHDYYPNQIPLTDFSDYRVIFSLLIYTGFMVFAFAGFRRKSIVSFAILLFFITFSIVSNMVFNIGTFMNERFLFTSLLAFCIVIGWAISIYLPTKFKNPYTYHKVAMAILIIILTGYTLKTITRNRVWKNDFTLFTTDVKVSANSTKCNTSAGGKLLEEADSTSNDLQKKKYIHQAKIYLQKAIEIYPGNLNAKVLLGNAFIKEKDFKSARICFMDCLKINPKYQLALHNLLFLGQTSNQNLDFNEAKICFATLNQLKPNLYDNNFGLGIAYRGLGKFDSALVFMKKSVVLKPDNYEALGKIGEIFGQNLNQIDSAEKYFSLALKINPQDASSLENMGIIYGMRKDYTNSIKYFSEAIKINPKKYELYMNIALTYRLMGNQNGFYEYLQKAEKIRPSKK